MRKFTLLLSAIALTAASLRAQTVSTFEALSLAHADTFYTNYTASGTDVGFNNGLAHFPCVYDTSWGGFWEQGFAYSNMTDSVTSGFMNQYSAKTAIGYAGSAKYAVAYCYNPVTFGNNIKVKLTGIAMGHPVKGFYVTNNTYAYNSMRDGDAFAKKFHNGDWFKIVARGYYGGVMKPDSVGFYLANFLHPDSTDNYIVNTWEWFDLLPLGNVDSLEFTLTSTDNGSFGMNTPAYFCLDDFTTYETYDTSTPPTIVKEAAKGVIKVYPQPANEILFLDVPDAGSHRIAITNIAGAEIASMNFAGTHNEISTAALPSGIYFLHIFSEKKRAVLKFIKQ